jgi:hypothetical protein
VNVALHALNAVLVSRLAKRLALPGAWLLGALFALHPVHVESVAWISERKNVLSGLFYLLAALAYLRFELAKGNGVVARRMGWYSAAFALFVLALLAKSVTCSLPAALILFLAVARRPRYAARAPPARAVLRHRSRPRASHGPGSSARTSARRASRSTSNQRSAC